MTIKEAIKSLKMDAEHVGFDTAEVDLPKQARRFIEAVRVVAEALESPRDWMPCAEGLPVSDKKRNGFDVRYTVTMKGHKYGDTYLSELCYIRNAWREDDESGAIDTAKREVIAWMHPIYPYNPDHIRDATKKED